MSEKVRSEAGGLRLYQGPLGLTISGTSKSLQSNAGLSTSYPTKVTPFVSTVKIAKLKPKIEIVKETNLQTETETCSDVTAWRHISSSNNYCGDILTRGETPDKLGPGSAWQSGPAWLTQNPETWPVTEVVPTKEERNVDCDIAHI